MPESVFLKKVKFKKDFGPFKGGTEIEFNDGMEDIIKFYLERKEDFPNEKAEDVAKRMKINVIVGENGSGKSKLFEGLVKGDKILEGDIKNFSSGSILIDDFFFYSQFNYYGEKSEYKSINNYLFWADRETNSTNKYNKFIGYFYELCSNSTYYKIVSTLASSFLNIKNTGINFYFNFEPFDKNKDIENYKVSKMFFINIFTRKLLKDLDLLSLYNFNKEGKYTIGEIYSILQAMINKSSNKLFRNEVFKDYIRKLNFESLRDKRNKNYLIRKLTLTKAKYNDILKLLNLLNKLVRLLQENESNNGRIFVGLILNKKSINKTNFEITKEILEKIRDTGKKINSYINNFRRLDIDFGNGKKFKQMSSGEKIIFIRFINIIGNILEKIEENKKVIKSVANIISKINKAKKINKNIKKQLEDFIKKDLINEEDSNKLNDFINDNNNKNKTNNNLISIIKGIRKNLENKQKNFLILIDEPDLHLHLDWQKQYIQKLVDVFGDLLKDIKDISLHFIIATHSPFLLSDVPAENVILLKKGDDGFTKVTDWWGNEFGKDNNILNIKDVLDSLNKLKNGKGS